MNAAQARLQLFLRHTDRAPVKNGVQRFEVRLVLFSNGDQLEANAEIVGEIARVGYAVLGRIRTGHTHADHVFLANRVDGDRRRERGVDAAAQSDDDALESAFVDVVAGSHDEGLVDSLAFIRIVVMTVTGEGP